MRLSQYDEVNFHDTFDDTDLAVKQAVHRTIVRVTSDLERWSYNTAVAALMELLNTVSKQARSDHGAHRETLDDSLNIMLKLLAPMAPHITAELWEQRLPGEKSVHLQSWPVADPCLLYTSPSPRDRTRSRMPSSA